jgi:integrin beta 1
VFPIWAIVVITIGAVVFTGVIIIVAYQVFMNFKYKQEFARFNEEKQKANWGTSENPLFKPATSRFENPAYSKIHAN